MSDHSAYALSVSSRLCLLELVKRLMAATVNDAIVVTAKNMDSASCGKVSKLPTQSHSRPTKSAHNARTTKMVVVHIFSIVDSCNQLYNLSDTPLEDIWPPASLVYLLCPWVLWCDCFSRSDDHRGLVDGGGVVG